MDLDTILGRKVLTSAKINDIWVPANQFGAVLQRFSEPALFHNPGYLDFDLSHVGTVAKIKYRRRYFGLLCAHQGRQFEFEQMCLPASDSGQFISSNGCHYVNSNAFGEDIFDCRLYDFSEAVADNSLDSKGWFDLSKENNLKSSLAPNLLVSIGHPFASTRLKFDPKHLECRPYEVIGQPVESSIANRKALKLASPIEFEPDGFSGSPVFGVYVSESSISVLFEGIVTNANRSVFNYTSRKTIDEYIDQLSKDQP